MSNFISKWNQTATGKAGKWFYDGRGRKKKNIKKEKAIANNEMAPLEASGRELIKQ